MSATALDDEIDDDAPVPDLAWTGTPPGAPQIEHIRLTRDLMGQRLDKALAVSLPHLSRARLQALLDEGAVRLVSPVERPLTTASTKVGEGWEIEIAVPAPVAALPEPQDIPLVVPYEDEFLLVVDKPAGLVVHPAAGNLDGTLVNALLFHCGDRLSGIGGVRRPGIVHRLDKDTSGLMVVAKTDAAHRGLAAQLADRSLKRTYQAVTWGVPQPKTGRIEGNVGRSPSNRKKMAVVAHGGKEAVTLYSTLALVGAEAALVECRLMTGRTHQIRVHMASRGHPLVGDPLYGRSRRTGGRASDLDLFPRQALHAVRLAFTHPVTGVDLEFDSALPGDIRALLNG